MRKTEGTALEEERPPRLQRYDPEKTIANILADPVDYYVAPPAHGESVAMSGRVHTEIKGMVAELVQSRRTRFKTEGEVVRAAMTWFLVNQRVMARLSLEQYEAKNVRLRRSIETARRIADDQ